MRALALAAGVLGAAVLTVSLGCLTGCAPTPASSPTPTSTPAFASEEEAFAAAEEVYRAYNDALNKRRAMTEGADPQQYLTGSALEGDIDGQNILGAEGLRIVGEGHVTRFTGESEELGSEDGRVVGLVCIDVSGVHLLNEADMDVTPPGRGDTVAQRVTFVGSAKTLLIAAESTAEATAC